MEDYEFFIAFILLVISVKLTVIYFILNDIRKKIMKLDCTCEEWKIYIKEMEMFDFARNARGLEYKGPYFKFCPFCGKWWGLTMSSDLGWKQELLGEFIEEEDKNEG